MIFPYHGYGSSSGNALDGAHRDQLIFTDVDARRPIWKGSSMKGAAADYRELRRQSFEFKESTRNRVLHGKGRLDATGAPGTFAPNHRLCLQAVGLRFNNLAQAVLQDT